MSDFDRTPLEEVSKRMAEAGGGLAAAAKAVGLEDHRRMLADNARRLREGHLFAARAAGMALPLPTEAEDDAMGDILVCGDIYGQNAAEIVRDLRKQATPSPIPAPQQQAPPPMNYPPAYPTEAATPAPPIAVAPTESTWMTWLKRAGLVALPVAGAAGVLGYQAMTAKPEPVGVERPAENDTWETLRLSPPEPEETP